MSRYSAEYWKDRADEIRTIRDSMVGEEARRIMSGIAADYDRLCELALKSGSLDRQQAIEVLVSSPFSPVTRKREPKE
jgi:hypothetical protein